MPVYYQKEEYIRIAIQTIMKQTFNDFKLVIVIDGAPNLIPLVEDEIKGDVRVLIASYPDNQGVAFALNIGFEILMDQKYEFLTWVSTDNVYYPNFLKTLYSAIKSSSKKVGIVYSSFNQILEDGSSAHDSSYLTTLHDWQNKPKMQLLEQCIIGPSFIHRTKYCRKIDGYRFKFIQDYDFWIRMTEYCDIKYIPVELMEYRLNSPFSLSTHIKSDYKSHRLCWNEVHLSQFQSRQRRKITVNMTVIFIVRNNEVEKSIEALNKIVDQYFTNYELLIISITTRKEIEEILKTIDDPRIRIIYFPYHNDKTAIIKALHKTKTDICIIFDINNIPKDEKHILNLYESFKNKKKRSYLLNYFYGRKIISRYYDNENNVIESQIINNIYKQLAHKKSLIDFAESKFD